MNNYSKICILGYFYHCIITLNTLLWRYAPTVATPVSDNRSQARIISVRKNVPQTSIESSKVCGVWRSQVRVCHKQIHYWTKRILRSSHVIRLPEVNKSLRPPKTRLLILIVIYVHLEDSSFQGLPYLEQY
jgi:hypothetical protein